MTVDRQPVPAAIFDFALFFFHNARELLAAGSGPYFYLPKMQVLPQALRTGVPWQLACATSSSLRPSAGHCEGFPPGRALHHSLLCCPWV